MVTIVITQKDKRWIQASVKDRPDIRPEIGPTTHYAIGVLIQENPALFNIEIISSQPAGTSATQPASQ